MQSAVRILREICTALCISTQYKVFCERVRENPFLNKGFPENPLPVYLFSRSKSARYLSAAGAGAVAA